MEQDILISIKQKIKDLPDLPGVYIMKNKALDIIYIGKAKNLKNRVSTYFRAIDNHEPKVYKMVQNVYTFEYIVTSSEFEALLLECSLIKQHTPKYNILLKDDKGYSYLKITGEPYPRLKEEKQKLNDESIYLGPYNSAFIVKQTIDEANKIFRLPTCSRKFPQEIGKGRPCLNYHLKLCMGVCKGGISQKDYNEILEQAKEFINQGGTSAVKTLEKRMELAAENLDFERAAMLRDRINAISKINQKQAVVETDYDNQDVMAFIKGEDTTCCSILIYRNRRLVDKQDYLLGETDNLEKTRAEFILSYYNRQREIPEQITLDGDFEDTELILKYLTHISGKKVSVNIPKRGDKTLAVKMAETNAAQRLSQLTSYSGKDLEALDRLAKVLGLKNIPQYIEAYDISNFGDSVIVGGMVVFENAKPLKSAYKKFNMKTVTTRDDYASMAEMITRRFNRYFEEKEKGTGFGKLPDLILLDGGTGHVSTIAPIISGMGLDIPVLGMVKDSKHKTRAITCGGEEISIVASRSAYTLVSAIQEEVHRYSIAHSRAKHQKNSFTTTLTQVEGIGEKKAMEILRHFKTQKALLSADCDELAKVKGVPPPLAQKLFDHLHK